MIAYYDGFDDKTRELAFTPSSTAEAEKFANLNEKSFKIEDTGPLDPMTIYDSGTGLGHWDNDTQLDEAKDNRIDDVNDKSGDLLKTFTHSGIKFNLKNNEQQTQWLTVQRDSDKGKYTFPSPGLFVTGKKGEKLVFADQAELDTFLNAVFDRIGDVKGDSAHDAGPPIVYRGEGYLKDEILNAADFPALGAIVDDRV